MSKIQDRLSLAFVALKQVQWWVWAAQNCIYACTHLPALADFSDITKVCSNFSMWGKFVQYFDVKIFIPTSCTLVSKITFWIPYYMPSHSCHAHWFLAISPLLVYLSEHFLCLYCHWRWRLYSRRNVWLHSKFLAKEVRLALDEYSGQYFF